MPGCWRRCSVPGRQQQVVAAAATDALVATGAAPCLHRAKLHWQQSLLLLVVAHLAQQGDLSAVRLLVLELALVLLLVKQHQAMGVVMLLFQLGLSLAAVNLKEPLQPAVQQQQQQQILWQEQIETPQHRGHPLRLLLLHLLLKQLCQGNLLHQQALWRPWMQTVQVCRPSTPAATAAAQQAGRQAFLLCRHHRHPQQQQPRQRPQRSWHVAGASAAPPLLRSRQITACQARPFVSCWRQQT